MALRLGINIGFVTNSSSVVYHFPVEVLSDPTIQAFLNAFEISGGFVGAEMWHRGACASFAVTREQKEELNRKFNSINDGEEVSYTNVPQAPLDDNTVTLVYGDEYTSLASNLTHLLREAAKRMGIEHGGGDSYN
jgi:hypothetical protein